MTEQIYKLNALPSPTDERDYKAEEIFPADLSLPKVYDPRLKLLDVIDQGAQGSCFPSDAMVLMEDFKYKEISDVMVGDKVITHNSNIKKVTEVFKRTWQGNTHILSFYGYAKGIECTPEHPILTNSGWKKAKDITISDYVAIPTLKTIVKDCTILEIEKDPEFLYVLGLYIAEGCTSDTRVNFTLCSDEEHLAKRIKEIMLKYGAKVNYYMNEERHVCNVRLHGRRWKELFEELGGKICDSKRINKRLLKLDPILQSNILKGWQDGDGHETRNRNIGVTTSKELTWDMYLISLRNEMRCSVQIRKEREGRRQAYVVEVSKLTDDNWRRYRQGDTVFAKIFSNKVMHAYQRGLVYNLEVDDDSSYIVNGVSVHNCVGCATAALKEIQEKKNVGFEDYMSPQFVYNNRNWAGEGMFSRDSMSILYKKGIVPEEEYPYGTYGNSETIPRNILEKAANYRVKGYAYVNTIETAKAAIFRSGGCIATFSVYNARPNFWKASSPAEAPQGMHAVACFSGGTKVRLLNGKTYTFKELTDKYADDEFWVYSCDEYGNIVPGLAHHPRVTGVREIIKITLDNYKTIECTADHLFLLKNCEYKKAIDLLPTDSLMPLYTKVGLAKGMKNYEMVFNPETSEWIYTHRLVSKNTTLSTEGNVIHHIDFNKNNNSPENLIRMSWKDHTELHAKQTIRLNEYSRSEEGRTHSRNIMNRNWENQEWREKILKSLKENAHKGIETQKKNGGTGFSNIENYDSEHMKNVRSKNGKLNCVKMHSKEAILKRKETQRDEIKNNPDFLKKKQDIGIENINSYNKKLKSGEIKYTEQQLEAKRLNGLKASWTKWKQNEFPNFEDYLNSYKEKQKQKNHKIIAIEKTGRVEDVYDLTVEEYHNFALDAGVFVHNCIGWTEKGFIIRNSWGESFGFKGYTILPYEEWNLRGEVWTLIDDDSSKPDPKYSKWYWKTWRAITNTAKNIKTLKYVLALSWIFSIFIAFLEQPLALAWIPSTIFVVSIWSWRKKLYMAKG